MTEEIIPEDVKAVLEEMKNEGLETGQTSEQKPEEKPAEAPEAPSQEEKEEKREESEQPVVEKKETIPEVDRKPKEPALVPAWKVKVAQERLERENADLKAKLDAFQKNPTTENKQATADSIANIRELAEAEGLELDERQERFFKRIASAITEVAVPKETLKDIEAYQKQVEINHLESQFEQEFTKDVLPTLTARFGDLPKDEIASIRTKLHDLAFSETYAKVPLQKVFKAESEDMGIRAASASAPTPKSGKTRGTDINFENMSEEEFANLSDEQVDLFMAKKAGTSNWNLNR